MSAVEVTLGLGGNIGDKAATVRAAAAALGREGVVRDLVLSSLYRTAPWGDEDQDWFVNACVAGVTDLPPLDLLGRIKAMEVDLGRTPTRRWGPRVVDIDILTYGDLELATAALTLPHREILNRPFVVVPLAEIRPHLPIRGSTPVAAASRLDCRGVVKLEPGREA